MSYVQAGIASYNMSNAAENAIAGYYLTDQAIKNRPEYKIPAGYYHNLDMARQLAIEGTPAAVANVQKQGIDRNLATGANTINSLNGGLRGLAPLVGNANDAYGKMAAESAGYKLKGQQELMGTNKDLSNQEALAYQLNQLNPSLERQAAQSAAWGSFSNNAFKSSAAFSGTNTAKDYNAIQNQNTPKDISSQTNPSNQQTYNYSPYVNTNDPNNNYSPYVGTVDYNNVNNDSTPSPDSNTVD